MLVLVLLRLQVLRLEEAKYSVYLWKVQFVKALFLYSMSDEAQLGNVFYLVFS